MDKDIKNGVKKFNLSNSKFPLMISKSIYCVRIVGIFFLPFSYLLTLLLFSMFVLLSGHKNCLSFLIICDITMQLAYELESEDVNYFYLLSSPIDGYENSWNVTIQMENKGNRETYLKDLFWYS